MSAPVSAAPPRRRGRIAVLASGRGSNLVALLDACADGRLAADVVFVASDKADAPALARARERGVAAVAVDYRRHVANGGTRAGFDARVVDVVSRHNPDLVVLAGYMRVVGEPFFSTFRDRLLNLHPALPGAFPGLHAIARAHAAFAAGEIDRTGVMVHRVTAVVDGGEPVAIEAIELRHGEALDALSARVHAAEHRVIVRAVERCLPAAIAACDARDAREAREAADATDATDARSRP